MTLYEKFNLWLRARGENLNLVQGHLARQILSLNRGGGKSWLIEHLAQFDSSPEGLSEDFDPDSGKNFEMEKIYRIALRKPRKLGNRVVFAEADPAELDAVLRTQFPSVVQAQAMTNEISALYAGMDLPGPDSTALEMHPEGFEGFVAFLANRKQRMDLAEEMLVKVLFTSGCEWRRLTRKLVNYGNAIDLEASLYAARKVFDDGPVVEQEPSEKVGLVDVDPGPVDVDDRERQVPGAVSGNDDRQVVVVELIGCDVNDKFLPPQPRVAFFSPLAAYVVKAAEFLLLKVMREKKSRLAASAIWKTPQGSREGFRICLHNRSPKRIGQLCQLVHVWVHHRINDIFISKERPLSVEAILKDNERRRAELYNKTPCHPERFLQIVSKLPPQRNQE